VRVARARDAAAQSLVGADWSHARFEAERSRCNELLARGRVGEALLAAQKLHGTALAAGEDAFDGADFDIALAFFLLGRVPDSSGQAGAALPTVDNARRRFEAIDQRRPQSGAARMAAVAVSERGEAMLRLGRLDEAAQSYEEAVASAQQRADDR